MQDGDANLPLLVDVRVPHVRQDPGHEVGDSPETLLDSLEHWGFEGVLAGEEEVALEEAALVQGVWRPDDQHLEDREMVGEQEVGE